MQNANCGFNQIKFWNTTEMRKRINPIQYNTYMGLF